MSIIDLILIGIGLSMDAFAVAVCKGLKMPELNYGQTAVIALFFGGFQALMPFIGWAVCRNFYEYIKSVDHWVAFILLAFIGGKMVYESFKNEDDETKNAFDIKELFVLAIATSIDALAVGVTFAFKSVQIVPAITIIGITTFILSAIGVLIGHRFGAAYKNKAELAGGIILILIGTKILIEDLANINLDIFGI